MDHSEIVRRQARIAPDAIAVMRAGEAGAPDTCVSYRGLDRTIDAVAHRLQSAGLRVGTVASVPPSRHYTRLVMTLALARAGVTMTSAIDPAIASVLIVPSGHRGNDAMICVDIPDIRLDDPIPDPPVPPVTTAIDPDDVAQILSSSGSTGRPKAIPLTHRQFDCRLEALARAVSLPPTPRVCCPLGPFGGYGYRHLIHTLALGGTIVLGGTTEELARTIRTAGVQFLVAPPATLRDLVTIVGPDHEPYPVLMGIETGGSPLPAELRMAASMRLCPNIAVNYGTAETGPVSFGYVNDLHDAPRAAGRVIPGVEVEIVDERDRPLAPGATGRIRVRADGCAKGYFGVPPGTGAVFRDGWVYTRDTGSLSGDRVLSVLGRTQEIINAGGIKVAPADIEDRLAGIPGISDACVFTVSDTFGVDRIWLAVVPTPTFDATAFRTKVKAALGGAHAPQGVLMLKVLPRNANGKVLRKDLITLALAQKPRG